MRMSVDWTNLTFKAKDIVAFIAGITVVIFVAGATNQKLNTIIENQSENKELFKNIADRLNNVEKDQLLLKQRVDAWEKQNDKTNISLPIR